MTQTVGASSLITLHYSIASETGQVLVSTFSSTPATLQLGKGELLPTLERCLIGLPVGKRSVFVLPPEDAFGVYHPKLVERVPRAVLPADGSAEESSVIEFTAPDGAKFAGVLREFEGDVAVMDFNHPLAGKTIRFEVDIIGIL